MPIRRLLIAAGFLMTTIAHAAMVERVWLKYGEIAQLYEKFESIAPEQRRGLHLRLRLDPSVPVVPGGMRLFVNQLAARVEVPLQTEHLLVLPRDAEWRKEDPDLVLQAPAGVKVGLVVEVSIDPPALGVRGYADWMQSVQQAAAGMRKHAGFWAIFMPKAIGLELSFPKGEPATATMAVNGVDREWQADATGRLIIPLESELLASNSPLRLSRGPVLAMPYFKTSVTLMPSGESAAE